MTETQGYVIFETYIRTHGTRILYNVRVRIGLRAQILRQLSICWCITDALALVTIRRWKGTDEDESS